MNHLATVVRERTIARSKDPGLDSLRGALARAGAAAREEVVIDFLEDDLRAAEDALDELYDYVSAIGTALHGDRTRRAELLAMARDDDPVRQVDELQGTITGLRRRVAAIALRLPL